MAPLGVLLGAQAVGSQEKHKDATLAMTVVAPGLPCPPVIVLLTCVMWLGGSSQTCVPVGTDVQQWQAHQRHYWGSWNGLLAAPTSRFSLQPSGSRSALYWHQPGSTWGVSPGGGLLGGVQHFLPFRGSLVERREPYRSWPGAGADSHAVVQATTSRETGLTEQRRATTRSLGAWTTLSTSVATGWGRLRSRTPW